MSRIGVYLAEGFEEIEAVSIIDVLRRAELDVITISVTGNIEVTGAHQIKLVADFLFEEVDHNTIDMIVLPGGMPGARNLNNHDELKNLILQFNDSEKPLGAICAAPLVFGQLGILKNKKVTCFPGYEEFLIGSEITNSEAVVVSNHIITGKGAGVAIKFALKIVERFKGKVVADELAARMIVL